MGNLIIGLRTQAERQMGNLVSKLRSQADNSIYHLLVMVESMSAHLQTLWVLKLMIIIETQ